MDFFSPSRSGPMENRSGDAVVGLRGPGSVHDQLCRSPQKKEYHFQGFVGPFLSMKLPTADSDQSAFRKLEQAASMLATLQHCK